MKYLFLYLVLFSLNSFAQPASNRGIQFFHGTWQEACQKAMDEDKLIFVDFYTRWCGPCLNMTEEVFPLSFIGEFYNEHFVCVKIDAENGEGVSLAKQYGIISYPTYLFIEPGTGEVVHRSQSRQSAEQFFATGQSALEPELRSVFLLKEFAAGNNDRQFLINYIRYAASIYDRDGVTEAFRRLIDGGAQLTEPDIWELYSMNIAGVDNPYFQEVIRDYARFVSVLGKERVDRKLSQETRNVPEEDLAALPDFNGKRLNIYLSRINAFIRDKNYDEADVAIKEVLGDSLIDKQEFMAQFRYVLRGSYWRDDTPLSWLTRCASYLQYIAYNDDNRTDPYIHQEYAAFLERLIRLTPGAEAVFPTSILDKPEFGVQEYNMRPRNLLPKPKKKKTID